MSVRAAAHVLTRAEMARRLGVSRAAVTRACKPDGRLAPACVGTGVDVFHAASQTWLGQRAAARIELPPLTVGIAVDAADEPDAESTGATESGAAEPVGAVEPAELERQLGFRQFADLADLAEPLTTLTERYGDAPALERWVRCRKTLEDARKAEMLRGRIQGRLIARTTVIRMIDHVDVAFRLLLSDAPRTIATRLSAADMPGATAMVRDVMTQVLEAAIDHMSASLEADDPMAPLMEAAE